MSAVPAITPRPSMSHLGSDQDTSHQQRALRILVAEDSLTTRTLVRNLVTARASADDRVRGILGRGANLARTPEAA